MFLRPHFGLQVLIQFFLFTGFHCLFQFSLDASHKEIWFCLSVNKTLIYLWIFPKGLTLETMHVYQFQFKGFNFSLLMRIFNYEKTVFAILYPEQCKSLFSFIRKIYRIYLLVTLCNEVIPSKVYNTINFFLFIFYEYTLDIHVNSIYFVSK